MPPADATTLNREAAARRLADMPRDELLDVLHHLRCEFPLDFSDEYLQTLDVHSLRHVILAACLHARDLPSCLRCA